MATNGWYKLDPNYKPSGRPASWKNQQQNQARPEANQKGKPGGTGTRPPEPVPPAVPEAQGVLSPWNNTAKHSQTVGPDGPVVLHDTKLHETLGTFATAKIPERAVHVKGWGASGYFQLTNSMRKYTKASLFQTPGTQVPVRTRFSLAVSTKGTPDTSRNVRGFSTKFYLNNGVFDLLCNHIPVFLVRDAIRFPESIEAFLPNPANNLVDPNRFWGFVARAPEATHFVTWLYSDAGTIKSLRRIHGYSVNTYVWRNASGARTYVKYHWVPSAGEQCIDAEESGKLACQNPDLCGQDLYDAIAAGRPVEYQLCVQLMDPADAAKLSFDPLDDTKVWDEKVYPLVPVGRMVLNKNTMDYNEQVEKVAFSPANLLDGIELSNDKMLEGRSFIYYDAQRHRLGSDFRKLPVNRQADFTPSQLPDTGIDQHEQGRQERVDIGMPDNFTQAGERYRGLSDTEQSHLVSNIAGDLSQVSADIQRTVLGYFRQADTELAERISQQMKPQHKR